MKTLIFFLLTLTTAAIAQDWQTANPTMGDVPEGAFKSGKESDGTSIYIMRTTYRGGLCVGKYVPRNRAAYISYGGQEIAISDPIEVFCGYGTWVLVSSTAGQIPTDMIFCGSEENGNSLGAIRATFKGGVQVGKYSAQYRTGYFPYGGLEYEVQGNFSILVNDRSPEAIVKAAAVVAAPKKMDYNLVIYYNGTATVKSTETNNNISISVNAEGNHYPLSQTYNTFTTPATPFSVSFSSETPVKEIYLSTDGDNGFRIVEVDLLQVGQGPAKTVAKWGNRSGTKGYCLSTDPKDSGGEWTGFINEIGCAQCLLFQVAGNRVSECPGQ